MISYDNSGGRTIHLYIPFDFSGKRIDAITLAPLRFGHVLRWNEGAWQKTIELMTELAGVEESVIRELRYPDADRVMEAFMALLTPELREDIVNGRVPQKPPDLDRRALTRDVEQPEQRAGNGSGPGAPLPPHDDNPGFDLSEEP